ncbi:MAG: hypothetical protein LQ343_005306 [Gyalolechia ehrenbergii]|nr:MAG: hypothetical protein LQ343_005306 [Gyalolechia ehrenbergii]
MGNHGLRGNFRPDYTIFQNPEALAVYCEAQARGKSILINKEELGHECWNGECDYEIFPDKSYIERTEPTFLFRDPLRTHFGFDLDDTLHEFRKASGATSASIFEYLSEHNKITFEELKETYAGILAKTTSGAFAEGKRSEDYRRERFTALMQAYQIEARNETLQHLLGLYKASLQTALALKSGALELLSKLKGLDRKVILVTEGPEDAQRWTMEELGIADKVNVLITSNKFGRTKTDGLFGIVLTELSVEAKNFVFVGDNIARDIMPAVEAGIMTVHYSESENVRLELGGLRINSLWKFSELLTSSEDEITVIQSGSFATKTRWYE